MQLGVAGGEHVHHTVDDLLERTPSVRGMRAKPAHRAWADSAQARCECALESVRVVGPAQRLEVADEKPDHLIARRRTPAAHLIRKAECAKRLLKWRSERGGAAQHDGEIRVAQPGPFRMQAPDLARAEECLADRIALARQNHRRRLVRNVRTQDTWDAVGLRRGEEALARVKSLLRTAAARLKAERFRPIQNAEVLTEQVRNSASKAVDRLVGIADDHKARARLWRRDETQQLELCGVDVLELVD